MGGGEFGTENWLELFVQYRGLYLVICVHEAIFPQWGHTLSILSAGFKEAVKTFGRVLTSSTRLLCGCGADTGGIKSKESFYVCVIDSLETDIYLVLGLEEVTPVLWFSAPLLFLVQNVSTSDVVYRLSMLFFKITHSAFNSQGGPILTPPVEYYYLFGHLQTVYRNMAGLLILWKARLPYILQTRHISIDRL